MGNFALWVHAHLPPVLTHAIMRAKRTVAPSAGFRRTRRIHEQLGRPDQILAGPFKGMRYREPAAYLPKLLGTYENELHEAVARIVALKPDVLINIGSAEGYYAVGFARLLPDVRVLAYDTMALPRYRTAKLAAINGVTPRVEPRGHCSPEELDRVCGAAARPAVLIDCEGCEWELLDPAKAPNLRRAIVLVETHEMCHAGVHAEIRRRFADSHDQLEWPARDRTPADLPPGITLGAEDARIAMDEARLGPQDYLLMTPRSASA